MRTQRVLTPSPPLPQPAARLRASGKSKSAQTPASRGLGGGGRQIEFAARAHSQRARRQRGVSQHADTPFSPFETRARPFDFVATLQQARSSGRGQASY